MNHQNTLPHARARTDARCYSSLASTTHERPKTSRGTTPTHSYAAAAAAAASLCGSTVGKIPSVSMMASSGTHGITGSSSSSSIIEVARTGCEVRSSTMRSIIATTDNDDDVSGALENTPTPKRVILRYSRPRQQSQERPVPNAPLVISGELRSDADNRDEQETLEAGEKGEHRDEEIPRPGVQPRASSPENEIEEAGEVREVEELEELRQEREVREVRELGEVEDVGKVGEERELEELEEVEEVEDVGKVGEAEDEGEVGDAGEAEESEHLEKPIAVSKGLNEEEENMGTSSESCGRRMTSELHLTPGGPAAEKGTSGATKCAQSCADADDTDPRVAHDETPTPRSTKDEKPFKSEENVDGKSRTCFACHETDALSSSSNRGRVHSRSALFLGEKGEAADREEAGAVRRTSRRRMVEAPPCSAHVTPRGGSPSSRSPLISSRTRNTRGRHAAHSVRRVDSSTDTFMRLEAELREREEDARCVNASIRSLSVIRRSLSALREWHTQGAREKRELSELRLWRASANEKDGTTTTTEQHQQQQRGIGDTEEEKKHEGVNGGDKKLLNTHEGEVKREKRKSAGELKRAVEREKTVVKYRQRKSEKNQSARRRVEDDKKEVQEEKREVEAEKKKVETEKKRVKTEKKKIEQEKRQVEIEKRRVDKEKKRVEAEKRADEEKKKVEAEKRVEVEKRKGEMEKKKIEMEKKKMDVEKRRGEKGKKKVDAENEKAKMEKMKVEDAKRKGVADIGKVEKITADQRSGKGDEKKVAGHENQDTCDEEKERVQGEKKRVEVENVSMDANERQENEDECDNTAQARGDVEKKSRGIRKKKCGDEGADTGTLQNLSSLLSRVSRPTRNAKHRSPFSRSLGRTAAWAENSNNIVWHAADASDIDPLDGKEFLKFEEFSHALVWSPSPSFGVAHYSSRHSKNGKNYPPGTVALTRSRSVGASPSFVNRAEYPWQHYYWVDPWQPPLQRQADVDGRQEMKLPTELNSSLIGCAEMLLQQRQRQRQQRQLQRSQHHYDPDPHPAPWESSRKVVESVRTIAKGTSAEMCSSPQDTELILEPVAQGRRPFTFPPHLREPVSPKAGISGTTTTTTTKTNTSTKTDVTAAREEGRPEPSTQCGGESLTTDNKWRSSEHEGAPGDDGEPAFYSSSRTPISILSVGTEVPKSSTPKVWRRPGKYWRPGSAERTKKRPPYSHHHQLLTRAARNSHYEEYAFASQSVCESDTSGRTDDTRSSKATDTSDESTCELLQGQDPDGELRVPWLKPSSFIHSYRATPGARFRNETITNKHVKKLETVMDFPPSNQTSDLMSIARMQYIADHLDYMMAEKDPATKMHYTSRKIEPFCENIQLAVETTKSGGAYELAIENRQRMLIHVDAIVHGQLSGKLGNKLLKWLRDEYATSELANVSSPGPTTFTQTTTSCRAECSPQMTAKITAKTEAMMGKVEALLTLYGVFSRELNINPQYFSYQCTLKKVRACLAESLHASRESEERT